MDPAEPLDEVASRVCAPLVARHRDRTNIAALIVVSSSTGGRFPASHSASRKSRTAHRCVGIRHELGLQRLRLRHDLRAVAVQAGGRRDRLRRRGDVAPIDKTDRNTACLFGDGTGAVLVESRSTFREYRWYAG